MPFTLKLAAACMMPSTTFITEKFSNTLPPRSDNSIKTTMSPENSYPVETEALAKKSTEDGRLRSDSKEAKASPSKIANIITKTLKTSSEEATFEFRDISPTDAISIQTKLEALFEADWRYATIAKTILEGMNIC